MTKILRYARALALVAALVLSTLVSTGGTPAEAAAAAAPTTTQDFVHEANLVHFLAGTNAYSRAEAIEIAERFDLVVAQRKSFQGHVSAMRAANPNVTVLAYQKGSTVPDNEGNDYPDSWYLKNANGNKVRSDPWGAYLMDVRKQGYRDAVVQRCYDAMEESGYHGCYFDVMGTGALSIMATTPVTGPGGPEFTRETWHPLMVDFGTFIRDTIPNNIPLVGNGLSAGRRYFDVRYPSSEVGDAMGWSHSEIWQRVAHAPANEFRDLRGYRWELGLLTDMADRGNSALVSTKLWASANGSVQAQWRMFAYGSFLLGNDGNHYFAFSPQRNNDDPDHPIYDFDIGVPVAAHQENSEGIFTRVFTKGRVVSNANEGSRTINLPSGTYVDYNGNEFSGSFSLGAHRAIVLRKQGSNPAPTPTPTPTPPPTGLTCRGKAVTIVGTPGDDVINGTPGADVIFAGGGDDRVIAGAGADIICGGPGVDIISGGGGDDEINGGSGNDRLSGNDGDDLLFGAAGVDDLHGGKGKDRLYGQANNDIVNGANDNDFLNGGGGALDKCYGGAGNDTASATCERIKSAN